MQANNDEIFLENWNRRDRERNEIFPTLLPDFNSLQLKRIDITGYDRNNHSCKNINKHSLYLCAYVGGWHLGKMYGNYNHTGWEFDMGSFYVPLRSLDMVFEVVNMPKYEHEPLGRLESVENSYDDYDEEMDA